MSNQIFAPGETVLYAVNGLQFQVKILNTKPAFGRVDYCIAPVAGTGETWVQAKNLLPLAARADCRGK